MKNISLLVPPAIACRHRSHTAAFVVIETLKGFIKPLAACLLLACFAGVGLIPSNAFAQGGAVSAPSLLGAWKRSSFNLSGSMSGEDVTVLRFFQNGTVKIEISTQITSDLGVGTPSVRSFLGKYQTDGRSLLIRWQTGEVEEFAYLVFDHEGAPALKLQMADQKPVYYLPTR